jgi:hypothetical protein
MRCNRVQQTSHEKLGLFGKHQLNSRLFIYASAFRIPRTKDASLLLHDTNFFLRGLIAHFRRCLK